MLGLVILTKINHKYLTYFLVMFTSINYLFFTHRFFQRENGYILGDWLINYEGGFVRRGFLGELITNISSLLNLDLINLTYFITIFFYACFIVLLLRLISKANISFLIAIIIFSPSLFLIIDEGTLFLTFL